MSLQGGGRGNEVGDTSSCQRKGWGIKLDLETKSYNAYPPCGFVLFAQLVYSGLCESDESANEGSGWWRFAWAGVV